MNPPTVDAAPKEPPPIWPIVGVVLLTLVIGFGAVLAFRAGDRLGVAYGLLFALLPATIAVEAIHLRVKGCSTGLFEVAPWIGDAYAFAAIILLSVHVGLSLAPLDHPQPGGALAFCLAVWLAWTTLPRLAKWLTGQTPPDPPVEQYIKWPSRRSVERAEANRSQRSTAD